MTSDWLVDGNRPDVARQRLIACATELIARRGVEDFGVNELARHAHCSRATVYRHAGGRKDIIDAVLAATSTHVVDAVRTATTGMSGTDKASAAITVALWELRHDRVVRQFLRSHQLMRTAPAILRSDTVGSLAAELIGIDPDDTVSVQLAIRSFLTLLLWPAEPADEDRLVQALIEGTVPVSR